MVKIAPVTMLNGSDPELFFRKDGEIVGSERVIRASGLKVGRYYKPCVVRDGIQVELNPPPAATVPQLGVGVAQAFTLLKKHLSKSPDVSFCFDGVVEVRRTELDSLSEKSRILGCMPSLNCYGEFPITVDPQTYRKRSAGGHLHLGLKDRFNLIYGPLAEERGSIVPILDIFVGNTGVLLDRDPGAAERRENYGRAGEHRLPKHGLEYRTLSNFWLRNYSLMSLVFGMANLSVAIINTTLSKRANLEQELIDVVDIGNFRKAIDTNNWDLARANFEVVKPFLIEHLPEAGFPLKPSNLDKFLIFSEGVRDSGLERFFPEPPVDHWVEGKKVEFDTFLDTL